MAQRVADGRPRRAGLEVADVVRHERRTRREDRQVGTAFLHQAQLVDADGFDQLVVADV